MWDCHVFPCNCSSCLKFSHNTQKYRSSSISQDSRGETNRQLLVHLNQLQNDIWQLQVMSEITVGNTKQGGTQDSQVSD